MRCQCALCDACITKLDGINHCKDCLDALDVPRTKAPPPRRAAGRLGIFVGILLLSGLTWLSLNAALPGPPGP